MTTSRPLLRALLCLASTLLLAPLDGCKKEEAASKSGDGSQKTQTGDKSTNSKQESPKPDQPATAKAGSFKVGDQVDVSWKGKWYQAKVISLAYDSYLVHYIGWEASWDENVPLSRMRAPVAGTQKGPLAE